MFIIYQFEFDEFVSHLNSNSLLQSVNSLLARFPVQLSIVNRWQRLPKKSPDALSRTITYGR